MGPVLVYRPERSWGAAGFGEAVCRNGALDAIRGLTSAPEKCSEVTLEAIRVLRIDLY